MIDNTNIVLAANIQKYRKKCGLTQEELAKKLTDQNDLPVTLCYISFKGTPL